MASVSVDPVSNQFYIRFRFAAQAFKRSLKTASHKEATAALARVEETLSLLQRGVLELPADADPATFLLSAGKTRQRPQKAEKPLTLGLLIDSYLKSLQEQAKEKTTLKTEATHIKHFRARLPMSKPVDSLTTNDIQQFINLELRRKVGAKFLSPDTVNGVRVSVFRGDNLLAAISQHLLVPDQGFEKTLQCPRCHVLVQSDGFRILPLHVGEEFPHINMQQRSASGSRKTIRKPDQKLSEQFAKPCDILQRYTASWSDLPWFPRETFFARGTSSLFAHQVNIN